MHVDMHESCKRLVKGKKRKKKCELQLENECTSIIKDTITVGQSERLPSGTYYTVKPFITYTHN